jgi:hypothetical protein
MARLARIADSKLIVSLASLVVVCVLSTAIACPPKNPPKPLAAAPRLFLRGYVSTQIRGDVDAPVTQRFVPHDVFIPDVDVSAIDVGTNLRTTPVKTDLSGRFTVLLRQGGRYRVCWEAKGFVPGCTQDVYSVTTAPFNVSVVRISPERIRDATTVFGHVTLADGSTPRLLEPLAGINAFATVTLTDDAGTVIRSAHLNNFGEYVFPQVPVRRGIHLIASIEGVKTDQPIRREANLAGSPLHLIDLQIANHAPRLVPLVATDSASHRIQVGTPGAVVRLAATADDDDGDTVTYTWLIHQGSGNLSSTNGNTVDWTLPNSPGVYTVQLIANDGKGGYAESPLSLRVDPQGIPFSGTVFSTAGSVVPGAEVMINGQGTTTDPNGFFQTHVPVGNRFVLNIRKPGFALLSQIYDRGITGGRWTLTRATVISADPTQTISASDDRSSRDCPGPGSARLDWKTFEKIRAPQWQDGKGHVISPPGKLEVPLPGSDLQRRLLHEPCGPGIRVTIPANSLQDENGNPPSGNVNVALATIDLVSPDQMPGDYTVQEPSSTAVMQSYGAGTVEISGGGRKYNLKPGATAEITITADRSQRAVGAPLPATIPILFYDEKNGVWIREGDASLQGTRYVAKVKHFSAINTDTIKQNQSCVRVLSPALPPSYKLEVTIPMGGGAAPKVLTRDIDNSSPSEHVIYNLPSGVNIVLAPYDPTTTIPFGTFVVNTGGQQNPTNPNLPAGPPYNACSTSVTLTAQSLPQAPSAGLEFLHGLFSFAATNLDEASTPATLKQQLDQASAAYYSQVDPRGKRSTLAGFNSTNIFDGTETEAIYANSGDLGFGRDMNCKQNGQDVACYVTNYGNILTPDAQDAADAAAKNVPVATVAMEYSCIEDAPPAADACSDATRVVKFFVYAADGNSLLRAANLDNIGARPVPQLCMVCHGGFYPGGPNTTVPVFNSRADVNLGSWFLPFDLHNYTFTSAPNDKATQQSKFKTLNQMVLASNPGPTTTEVINKMYSGANPNIQDEFLVASGWNAQASTQEAYKTFVANGCRTCHAANPQQNLEFSQTSQVTDRLGSVENRVCSQHVMPHAKRTHDLFWLSVNPHLPAQLQVFGDAFATPQNGWQGNLCGVFTAGGPTPVSPFSDIQNTIFTPVCAGCHTGSTPAGKLNLTATQSYANLVNVNACELASLKRVTPNDSNNSYLVRKVTGNLGGLSGCSTVNCNPFGAGNATCGSQMPLGGSALNAGDINKIVNWINTGALP